MLLHRFNLINTASRSQLTWRNAALLAVFIPVFILFAIIAKNFKYLITEFIVIDKTAEELETCNEIPNTQYIPLIIHQIHGFKDTQMEVDHINKRNKWIQTHRNYTHHLWNETAVTALIKKEYGQIYNLYTSYSSWVQRADVGRYVILYHYGGWYIDIDIGCNKGIHELAAEATKLRKHVILRHTEPVGISNDIFGITPRHPYLKSVIGHLHNANRWFLIPHWNILFSAGSTYMWGRYVNFPCKDDVIILEESRYTKYFHIDHDGSWHSWDTGTINVLFVLIRSRFCLPLFVLLLSFLFCIFLRILVQPRLKSR